MLETRLLPFGDRALLIEVGGPTLLAASRSVQRLSRLLFAQPWPWRINQTVSYAHVLIEVDPLRFDWQADFAEVRRAIADWLELAERVTEADERPAPTRTIPVCFESELAPDLDAAAAQSGLLREAFITRFLASPFEVAMIGFQPGFPYLLGLDPGLAQPRRATPRERVPAGSVAIAGVQAGIYPRESPGGWQLIGRTSMRLFDPVRDPPCPLAPGDRICFVRIGLADMQAGDCD